MTTCDEDSSSSFDFIRIETLHGNSPNEVHIYPLYMMNYG